jgi:putative transposase
MFFAFGKASDRRDRARGCHGSLYLHRCIATCCFKSGMDQATVMHRPRLLSDNGSSYVSGDLAKWLDRQDMRHTRGAPYHPMTQGKIERWHQTLKNRILLENYYLPGDLEAQINAFVAYYNHRRYHESIDNLTPADVYFGRGQTILLERERIKRKTIQTRRLLHNKQAA